MPLLLIARQARLREELLATPTHTYETLAQVRGTEVNATRFRIHKSAGAHRLLVVAPEGRTLVPAFQLTDDGEPRPDLLPVLEPLLAARMDPWRVWAWLTQPAALLGGQVPQEAAADPDEADVVRRAADLLAWSRRPRCHQRAHARAPPVAPPVHERRLRRARGGGPPAAPWPEGQPAAVRP